MAKKPPRTPPGNPRHPRTSEGVVPQTEGGAHPRGVRSKNYEREDQSHVPPDERLGDPGGNIYGAGKHFRDDRAGPDDHQRNPGIGSSAGSSGVPEREAGVEDRDWDIRHPPKSDEEARRDRRGD